MKLNEIRDNKGARKRPMIVGRGIGSAQGKTSGRGVKGQKARTGVRLKAFEGGQMPLYRRMPKRGFNNPNATQYAVMNIGALQQAIDAGRLNAKETITQEMMILAGVVNNATGGVSLLAKGALKAKVNVVVARASKSAVAAIEKLGGKVTIAGAEAAAA
ncbi:MAG: 50S ribosomal protein L15 [Alphaproteobacteria bacterium]|nr:50S ribosomal protein L15 [Alphaproteobacteria bacterium]